MLTKNRKIIALLIILIFLGIAMRTLSLGKDISAEETDFVKAAIAIKEIGTPAFYQSEQGPMQIALWHPPMYVYLLSLAARISTSETAFRLINVLATLLTSILIYFFCKSEFSETDGKTIGLIATSLFLINYYVLSSSILIDIDALSMLFIFSFLFFTLKYYRKRKGVFFWLGVVSFLFSLANRYPLAASVYLGMLMLLVVRKEMREYARGYVFMGLLSVVFFLLAWSFYSTFIEPGTFLYFINHNVTLGSEQFSGVKVYFLSFVLNIAQMIRLFTIPAVLLFLIAIRYALKEKSLATRMILISTLIMLLFFIVIPRPAFGYPRYFLSAMPGFFILISCYIYRNLSKVRFKRSSWVLLFLGALASLMILVLLNPQLTLYQNDGLIKSTNLPDFLFNLLGVLPLALVFVKSGRRGKRIILVSLLLMLLLVYSFFFGVKFVINESHIKEVGVYLKNNTENSDVIICPKAVAYYAERNFYANDYYKPPIGNISFNFLKGYFINGFENRKMDASFFWGDDLYGGIFYDSFKIVDEGVNRTKYVVLNYQLEGKEYEKKIGDYYIYNSSG